MSYFDDSKITKDWIETFKHEAIDIAHKARELSEWLADCEVPPENAEFEAVINETIKQLQRVLNRHNGA